MEVILIEIKRTKVEEKAENILLEIYPTLKNYTNAEKYRLCERIVNSFLDLLSFLARANKVRSKNFYSYLENRFDYIYRNQNGSFKIKNLKEPV